MQKVIVPITLFSQLATGIAAFEFKNYYAWVSICMYGVLMLISWWLYNVLSKGIKNEESDYSLKTETKLQKPTQGGWEDEVTPAAATAELPAQRVANPEIKYVRILQVCLWVSFAFFLYLIYAEIKEGSNTPTEPAVVDEEPRLEPDGTTSFPFTWTSPGNAVAEDLSGKIYSAAISYQNQLPSEVREAPCILRSEFSLDTNLYTGIASLELRLLEYEKSRDTLFTKTQPLELNATMDVFDIEMDTLPGAITCKRFQSANGQSLPFKDGLTPTGKDGKRHYSIRTRVRAAIQGVYTFDLVARLQLKDGTATDYYLAPAARFYFYQPKQTQH